MKTRLDQALVGRGLVVTRSQGESWIRLGKVVVNGKVEKKPGFLVGEYDEIKLTAKEQYVNRAALKLASVVEILKLDFRDKLVLDVGSSTGGFTEYALKHGARRVIAVEVGKDQLHASLRGNPQIELYEQTDIRDMELGLDAGGSPWGTPAERNEVSTVGEGWADRTRATKLLREIPGIVVIDVSFISLRDILPHIATLTNKNTQIVAMVKPQFEAVNSNLKHKGVIKNDRMRRDILKDFEDWARARFIIRDKADSEIAGSKGNLERFYLLAKLSKKE